MKDISAHLKSNAGMDGVLYATKTNQSMDLLSEWSKMDMNKVTEWYSK